MLDKKTKKKFKKIYKYRDGPFMIMVLGDNGYWNKSIVVGITKSGYLIFNGYFVGGCFEAKDYMTISQYNEKEMYKLSTHNGKKNIPMVDNTCEYINLKY